MQLLPDPPCLQNYINEHFSALYPFFRCHTTYSTPRRRFLGYILLLQTSSTFILNRSAILHSFYTYLKCILVLHASYIHLTRILHTSFMHLPSYTHLSHILHASYIYLTRILYRSAPSCIYKIHCICHFFYTSNLTVLYCYFSVVSL